MPMPRQRVRYPSRLSGGQSAKTDGDDRLPVIDRQVITVKLEWLDKGGVVDG